MKRSRQFAQVRAEMLRISTAEWRSEASRLAHRVVREAVSKEQIDLLGDVTLPWCVSILVALSGATQTDAERMSELAESLYCKPSSNSGSPRRRRLSKLPLDRQLPFKHREAERLLDRMLERKELAVSKPMFMAVSQSLPSFLVKSWLALLRNPAEVFRLRAEPALMANAVDELVRYAGIVHTLFRKADHDVDVAGIRVAKGQLVALKVASANFDPAKFTDPYRLDVTRRPAGQLALGSGLHACIGAALVRQSFTLLTPSFFAAGPVLDRNRQIVWLRDSMLCRPLAVFVNSGRLSQSSRTET